MAYYHRRACIASYVRQFFGGDFIEVRINKEVRDYNESLFFGLTLRQCLFALLAIAVAVAAYFLLRGVVGEGQIGTALPQTACIQIGQRQYRLRYQPYFSVAALAAREMAIKAYHQGQILSLTIYAKAMEHSTIKEALKLD